MQTPEPSAPAGPGTASGTPGLPAGFDEVFTSRWIAVGELRLHAVVGGDGPPLLLIPGWPQTWYAWRLLMPELARDFTVVAVDPRGTGLSGQPGDGYDTATLAADLTGLMAALGHERFAVAGHDVGMWIGYAMAADHPGRVARLALAEALIPGLSPSPPLFAPRDVVERLWHFAFNQLDDLNEQLVAGREDVFLRWQFTHKAARPLAEPAIEHYVDSIRRDPRALHASFGCYRAIGDTVAQNAERVKNRLDLPILTIAGERSTGPLVERTMIPAAADVRGVVLPGCGHYPAEEAPQAMLAALSEFLAPWADGGRSERVRA